MVYNTQNYWSFGLVHRPVFQKLENTTFRKMDLFPSSDKRGETPTQLGLLQRANLNHWTPRPLT
jgi:hypothetical protein